MTENIRVNEQNSIRIDSRFGAIYIDPFQIKEEPKDAAFILITHDHYDHFSPDDIAKVVGPHTIMVVPERMESKAQDVVRLMSRIVIVKPGVYKEIDGFEFETIAAYNTLKPFHRKDAGWVGYILRIDGKRIYIAGDTDATKEARSVKCDVALVPIGGTYTMDAKKAAELINEIRPSVAIPVHYGSAVGSPKDGDVFAANVKEPIKVEFKIQF
ncbi:MAG: MBL fold metallo-hydrolase [Lachnospiraceae bacterium]|nr:MBL fold metallo-hydrolase [Lachnospiraceae bacterium]